MNRLTVIIDTSGIDPTRVDPHEVIEDLTASTVGDTFQLGPNDVTVVSAEWEQNTPPADPPSLNSLDDHYEWTQLVTEPDDDGRSVWMLHNRATGVRRYVVRA